MGLTDTIECSSNHYTDHNQHKPPHTKGDKRILVEPLVVVIAAGKRPAPIPNLEAKPASADGTAPGRVWESRTPPQHSSKERGGLEHCSKPPSLFHTHPHNTRTVPVHPCIHRSLPGEHNTTFTQKHTQTPHARETQRLVNSGLISLLAYLFYFLRMRL